MAGTSNGLRYLRLFKQQGEKCYYCEIPLWDGTNVLNCNIDHKTAVSRGGSDKFQNNCLACISCNSLKGNLNEDEFRVVLKLHKEGKITGKDFPDYTKYLMLKKKFENV